MASSKCFLVTFHIIPMLFTARLSTFRDKVVMATWWLAYAGPSDESLLSWGINASSQTRRDIRERGSRPHRTRTCIARRHNGAIMMPAVTGSWVSCPIWKVQTENIIKADVCLIRAEAPLHLLISCMRLCVVGSHEFSVIERCNAYASMANKRHSLQRHSLHRLFDGVALALFWRTLSGCGLAGTATLGVADDANNKG